MDTLIRLTEKALLEAKEIQKYIRENMIANDGGLTIAGCDAMQDLTFDLRQVLNLLVKRPKNGEGTFKDRMTKIAHPKDKYEPNTIALKLLER